MSEGKRHRIVIDSAFQFGDFVTLRGDPEGDTGMIVGMNLRPSGLFYEVAWSNKQTGAHYEIELAQTEAPSSPLTTL